MFDIGDTIVHSRYGAGTVVGEKTITLSGEARSYICIQLTGERGTLMVQPEEVDPAEVRMTMDDMSLIRDVFDNAPQEMSDQHRSRQSTLRAKLRSNDPRQVAQALRDLIWRERTASLTNTDRRLMDDARKKLLQELKTSSAIKVATSKLDRIIEVAMSKHMKNAPQPAEA